MAARLNAFWRASGHRSIVLVGMMGAGKTSIGRRLANVLHLPFLDADAEIEKAANLTIAEIFAHYGEAHFREGERRVVARLLASGPAVLATGGGAFMSEETRERCRAHGVTIWLKADVPVLLERVRKKGNRPLLRHPDPEAVAAPAAGRARADLRARRHLHRLARGAAPGAGRRDRRRARRLSRAKDRRHERRDESASSLARAATTC